MMMLIILSVLAILIIFAECQDAQGYQADHGLQGGGHAPQGGAR